MPGQLNISFSDALNLFTDDIVLKYSNAKRPKAFGRSFFTETMSNTKTISIVGQKALSLVATDVARGARANLTVFDKSTQVLTLPPYFNEMFNMTELDSYDALTVTGIQSKIAFGRFLDDVGVKMEYLMDTIDRRYELQCWQAFLLGYVTVSVGQNLVFGRQAASLVDVGGAAYWTQASVDPNTVLLAGATWLNEVGKMAGDVVDVIMGESAYNAYINNTIVKGRALQVQWGLDAIRPQLRDSLGRSYHGMSSVGSFNMRFWTYPDFYEDENGTVYKYMDTTKIVMLPDTTTNILAYAAIPQLLTSGQQPRAGKFTTWEAITTFKDAHYIGVKSAGAALLGNPDQVYTAKVVAS